MFIAGTVKVRIIDVAMLPEYEFLMHNASKFAFQDPCEENKAAAFCRPLTSPKASGRCGCAADISCSALRFSMLNAVWFLRKNQASATCKRLSSNFFLTDSLVFHTSHMHPAEMWRVAYGDR
jgi:hypothetical protein